jgi:adenylosuccinate synthase
MSLSIVVGGQYGGEGKGAITAFLTVRDEVDILIKTGGPNSAHTFGKKKRLFRVRMVPCGANLGASTLVYPAGCLIHIPTLFSEIEELSYAGQIVIDPQAGIVETSHIESQQQDAFYEQTGSTLTGTGAAVAARARRRLRLAKDVECLHPYLGDTKSFLVEALQQQKKILVEGSQGFGLSNYHGEYPYSTSRDTTVGTFLGQVGLGPKLLDTVILVVKCFPTRNQHGKGNLSNELTNNFVSHHLDTLEECGGGSYSKNDVQRRVGLFDFDIVRRAIIANSPDYLALTGVDKLEALQSEDAIRDYYGSTSDFVRRLELMYGLPVSIMSYGPSIDEVKDFRFNTSSLGVSCHRVPDAA